MKIQNFCLPVLLLGAGVFNGAFGLPAKKIFIDLIKKATLDYSPDDRIVYQSHQNTPEDYNLNSGIEITFRDYKKDENIEIKISFSTNQNIVISKNDFAKFSQENVRSEGLRDVIMKIDEQGKIGGLSNNVMSVILPFTIRVVYQNALTIQSSPIGGGAVKSVTNPTTTSTAKKDGEQAISYCAKPEYANSLFCDALNFAKGLQKDTVYFYILKKYKKLQIPTSGKVDSSFIASLDNPILKRLLQREQIIQDRAVSQAKVDVAKKAIEFATGIISPEIAGGLAIFITERFKQELQVSFFDKFQETLRDEKHADLKHLFPMTHSLLSNRAVEPWDYNRYLSLLRAAFKRDFDTLPSGLKKLLEARKDSVKSSEKNAYTATLFALELVESVRAAKYPADVIEHLKGDSAIIKEVSPDFQNVVKLLAGISRNLRQSSAGKWIPAADLNAMLSEPTAIAVFAGLILEDPEIATLQFDGKTIKEWLVKLDKLDDVISYYYEFLDHIRNAEISLQALNELRKGETKPTFDDYFSYLGTAITLTETAFDVKRITANAVSLPINETYIQISRDVLSLWDRLNKKEYAIVLASLLDIVQKTFPDSPLSGDLLKYGTFMANMIAAESPEQVAQAIDAAALPVGSHRIKKISKFSAGLNAYAGLGAGAEFLRSDNVANDKISGIVAFTAPVGLALSWGEESCLRGLPGKSVSLFVSVLDLGALTSYRLQNGGDFPEFEVKNIVAPGGYVAFGFDGPFALGIGAQYGPELRKVDVKAMKSQITTSAWRAGAFLTVDIPILNFYKN